LAMALAGSSRVDGLVIGLATDKAIKILLTIIEHHLPGGL
jgi:hypothetical protein